MSEQGQGGGGRGFGPFLLGLAVGAVLGFLFAPDAGDVTRAKLTQRLRGLKGLAEEKAGELADRVVGEGTSDDPGETPPAALPSAREELERRLAEARRRRRAGKPARSAAAEVAEEDEPVA